ncbi:MAG: cyanase [Candidatus Rokubacteria bacterium 13_1_40CM_2_68_8]|nr:MAG: cyanase [Actinobacteria bacterium 13_1_40CM_4_65_12]OLD39795.1 MAG: cyanase [Candidatus Rokubacteria bacterium 13_1_40CM_2_68_8]
MTRAELTEKIVATRRKRGLSWAKLAKEVGRSSVWTTAALLGQMPMSEEEARRAAKALDLNEDEIQLLQSFPMRGSLDRTPPSDPTIYRFYELIQVYGTTWKELIHEEFGDGIMSAIDFESSLERMPDPKGDRVRVVMHGKFLPYRKY